MAEVGRWLGQETPPSADDVQLTRLASSLETTSGSITVPPRATVLLVAFGCHVVITRFGQGAQRGAMTMETPVKVTKRLARWW
jgi:hypothetical protein